VLLAKYVGPEDQQGFNKYQVYEVHDLYNTQGITLLEVRTSARKNYRDLNELKKDWIFVSNVCYTRNKRRVSDDEAFFVAAMTISLVSIAIVVAMLWMR
jgi:hypothetical protein